MGNGWRLVLIGFLSPLLAHLVGAVVLLAPMLLVTAVVGYPIMVVATFLLLLPLHMLFARTDASAWRQLLLVLVCGLGGGMAVYLALFRPNLWSAAFDASLALGYVYLGVIAALCCWLLYNWGPLRVAKPRSNHQLQRTRASGASRRSHGPLN
jgi:hypothetical protein